jgi:hypothetical protein
MNRYSGRTGILIAICVALQASPPGADAGEPRDERAGARGAWGKTIAAEPFEKHPFRQIEIPEWLETTTGVGYTLSVQTPEQRRKSVELGVTISELGFVDPLYVYYDSKLLTRRSPHLPADHIEKDLAEYRRLGVRILAVYPPSLQSEVWERHPDWRRIATDTTDVPEVDLKANPVGGMLCLLGPYGDFVIDVLAEITEKYRVDAWSFDGLHYGGVCYCEHCRRDYRSETSEEIPKVDMNSRSFRRYQHWADRRMEHLVQRMQTRLKAIKPECALVTWSTNAGRFGHLRDIPRNMPARMNLLFDAPDQEFWLDETNRGATIVPSFANAYIWACTNHRVAFSEPYLMSHGNPYGKDSFPAHEIERRMMLALTHGASPSLAVLQPPHMQAGAYQALAAVQKRKEWLIRKRPEPWGAMLVSDNTRAFYGRDPGKVEDRYLSSVLGTFRAVLEEHLPVTLICDWNINDEDLSDFQVLVLPNAASMNERQCEAIRKFVDQGGGLVASLDSSLCDEYGEPRGDFALADLFGASHGGAISADSDRLEPLDANFARGLDEAYWEKRKNVFDLRFSFHPQHPAGEAGLFTETLRSLVGDAPVTFKGPAVRIAPKEAAQQLVAGWPKGADERIASPMMVTNRYGKGRVVYFAGGVDAGYYIYPYPYQRELLAGAIRWAAKERPPVEVEAPMCVQSTVFRQEHEGRQRLLIHLFNNVNTTAFHAIPNDDVPLREETIPIHDIALSLHGFDVKEAVIQPERKSVSIVRRDSVTSLVVPRLDVHSIVVVELN